MSGKPESVPEPLVSHPNNKVLHSLLMQLDQTQWWPAAQMAEGQLHQLKKLLGYAILYSPFHRQRLMGLDIRDVDFASFSELPILSRKDLQENGEQLNCSQLPESHGKTTEVMTSGSTATPVTLRGTALTATMWNAINLREHIWHQRDSSKDIASIRWNAETIGMAPDGLSFDDWGIPINQFFKTGPSYYLNSSSEITDQLTWLTKIDPAYLMTHPSNLRALMEEARRQGLTFSNLEQVRTVGEAVSDDLRGLLSETFAVPLTDFYSCEELGYVALQCPENDHYHVQAEGVLVEVVREDGSACDLDETGRILLTSLRNYATPLIRYEVGDYGQLSGPCSCGRGLPVLKRINGRVRNMLRLPDGGQLWPNLGFRKMMEVAELKQFQVVQTSLEHLELKLLVDDQPTSLQEDQLKKILLEHLGVNMKIDISYQPSFAANGSGKFEDFVCLLNDESE